MDLDYKPYLCGLVWLSVWMALGVSGAGRCTYTRELHMFMAKCDKMDLEEIPSNLNTDIEVLYAAKNRIRALTNSSFQNYPDLKYLYLTDNFITKIEAGTFSDLTGLEVLDLSRNSVRSLPSDLPLPLRTLYLAQNDDLAVNLTLSAAYNLAVLSLAQCQLSRIPNFGMLPNLKVLNLTHNPELKSVTPADLAPLCRLERLYLPPSLYNYKAPGAQCECHRLLTWASQHYVQLPAFNCTPLAVDPDTVGCNTTLTEEVRVYKECLAVQPPPTPASYLLMAAVVGALLLACLVVLCWWRKGRRKHNSVEDHRRVDKNTKAADTLIT